MYAHRADKYFSNIQMRKLLIFSFSFLIFLSPAISQAQKAGGIDGGGAKGFVHVGALKIIEEAGIPLIT